LCCETLSFWIEGDQEEEIEILRARRLRELLTGGEDDGVSRACEEEEARAGDLQVEEVSCRESVGVVGRRASEAGEIDGEVGACSVIAAVSRG
jgi:hypothetical protein